MPQENTHPTQSTTPPSNKRRYMTDEELEDQRLSDEYAKSQGATGLAGGAKRSKPEYKKGFDAFVASRRKRPGVTAKDAGDALAKASESDQMIEEMANLPLPQKRRKP